MKQICLMFLIIKSLSGFSQTKKYTFSEPKMGSPFNITLYTDDSANVKRIATKAYQIVDSLNLIYSDYLPHSELNRLSAMAGKDTTVKVSESMWDILQKSSVASQKSKGAYDITVGAVVKLWRTIRKEKVLPTKKVLKKATQSVGYQFIILDSARHTAKILRPNTQLDLGGIAKGYIAQAVVDFCKLSGIQKVLVDAGGDLAMSGSGWKVGITIPNSEELMESYLVLDNQAVATSGNMYQMVEMNGKRYSHIVNPQTGLGVTHQRNVTVIAPDGATADWLATACSVLSVKKSLKLIRTMPNCEVLIAEVQKGKLKKWQSAGFEQYLVK